MASQAVSYAAGVTRALKDALVNKCEGHPARQTMPMSRLHDSRIVDQRLKIVLTFSI